MKFSWVQVAVGALALASFGMAALLPENSEGAAALGGLLLGLLQRQVR